MNHRRLVAFALLAGSALVGATLLPASAEAQRRGGGARAGAAISQGNVRNMQVRSVSASSVNWSGRTRTPGEVNRNVNVNHDANVDIDVDHHHDYDWGDHYHPVARATVVAATTAAVVGSYYRYLPADCATIYRGSIVYYQCGSAWYRPVYSGTTVQYVVVTAP